MTKAKASRPLSLDDLKPNARNKVAAAALMGSIPDEKAALVFMDPQYRTGLDKLKFGNEGSRQKARYALAQMTDQQITDLVVEAQRIIRPSGHLVLWADKFAMGSGQHLRYLRHAPALRVVDLIAWNKLRPGMGRRARCTTEYAVVVQKLPIRAAGVWTDHRIPDCWPEGKDHARHAHAKPYQLTERLIRATTKRGDLVVDPCAGGYGVLDACVHSGREFIGGDIVG